jgi:3D (Asp-Asp-Asp) domain-containing protein
MLVKANSSKKGMRYLLTTIGFAFLIATPIFAAEDSLLARITVYWRAEGQSRACSNGARLRTGHCAVDPKRIPFGSQVLFPDAACVAVDSGPAVVSRKAARMTGRTVLQRNAVVIDRFFESREAALVWERSHPHFMTVRVVPPGSRVETKTLVAEVPGNETRTAALPKTNKLQPRVTADGTELATPTNPLTRATRRRAL